MNSSKQLKNPVSQDVKAEKRELSVEKLEEVAGGGIKGYSLDDILYDIDKKERQN